MEQQPERQIGHFGVVAHQFVESLIENVLIDFIGL